MTVSKDKTLNVWQVPRQWINEEAPEGVPENDEESKFRTKKLEKLVEDTKFEETTEKYYEDLDDQPAPQTAFQNISNGFDPLGGGMVNAKPVKKDDDDLLGWNN